MAFVWKVEELKLRTEVENKKNHGNWNGIFDVEKTLNRDDKIAIVNEYTKGNFTRFLEAIDKFEKDKDNLKKDYYGSIKTVSLISWIKRNGYADIFDIKYTYGESYILGIRRKITNINHQAYYYGDTYDDIVDEAFHRVLGFYLKEETNYFKTHDTYTIKVKTVLNHPFTNAVIDYGWSSTEIFITDKDGNRRNLTVADMDKLLAAADKIRNYANSVKKEFVF